MLTKISDLICGLASPAQLVALHRTTPDMVAHAVAMAAFRRTVRHAGKHSVFYREAFRRLGIDPRSIRHPKDLGDFFTTPDQLIEHGRDLVCKPPQIVFESSGTSGRNKRVYFSEAELKRGAQAMAGGFRIMGLTPADRVANAFDFSIWIPGLITHYALMKAGCFSLAFGKVDPIEVYRRLDLHNFNVVLGEPTWLIRLTELAEKDGCRHKLKLMIGGAEEMPAAAIPWMKEVWGGVEVRMCYGSVEQGSGIGYQPCTHWDGYHVNTLDVLPEIVDADEEGWGEMVFTTLRRDVMPLIRYRTRDITRMFTEPCACGLRSPRIAKIRGRRDELVVASGGNLYPLLFENIIKEIPGLTHDWQVVFRLQGVREVVEVNLESDCTDADAARGQFLNVAASLYPDLTKNLALGIFSLEVVLRPPGTVRTGRKLKRLVDRRHFDGSPNGSPEREVVVVGEAT